MDTLSLVIVGILAVDLLIVVGFATIELVARRRMHREIHELDALWEAPTVSVEVGRRGGGAVAVERRQHVTPAVRAARRSRMLGSVSLGTALVAVATLAGVAAMGPSVDPGTGGHHTLALEPRGPSPDRGAGGTGSISMGGRSILESGVILGGESENDLPSVVATETPATSGDGGSVPRDVAVDAWTSTSIVLAWAPVSDAIGYRVERRDDGSQVWMMVGETEQGETTFTDSNLEPETTYRYRVMALTESGPAPPSVIITATTSVAPPDRPASLTAIAASSSTIALEWADVQDETGYRIERALPAGNWTTIAATGADVTAFTDVDLAAKTTYRYRIFAVNQGGESPASDVASAQTDKEAGTVTEPPDGDDGEDPPTDKGKGGGKGNDGSGEDDEGSEDGTGTGDGTDAGTGTDDDTGTDDGTTSGDIRPGDDPPPEETAS